MTTLYLDLETFAERDLKTYGTWAYAEVAEVMLLAYAWDDGLVEVVEFPSAGFMQSLIDQADQVVIQNSHFDRTVLGFMQVRIPTDKIFDTMVVALLHSLPGSLDKLCQVLAVPFDMVKDKAGKRLIQLFCKPRPKKQKIRRATKETHPAEWAEFVEYARMDIVSMREVYKRLPKVNWTPAEQALWRLDQTINDRGVQIDLDLAHAALRAAKEAGERLAVQAKDMTEGAVPSATQRDALLAYLRDVMGVAVEDLRKGTLASLLKTDLPDDVRELLEVRLQAAATSPAKYRVLTRATSEDGRLRGTLQYAGAARTSRWCLAEGAPVLVKEDTGRILEKPIETVSVEDLVWDGECWVRHEGVVFSGDKPVIEHDGVVATKEHVVYVSTTESMTLADAKAKGLNLWTGNGTQFTG